MSASSFLSLGLGLLEEEHLDFMHLAVDVGDPAVSDGSIIGFITQLLLLVLYLPDLLSTKDDVIFLSLLFLWVLQDGFLLLLFKIDLHWHCLTFNLHVVH